jgi:hypothetical protein
MKYKLRKWIFAYFDKQSLEYLLIKIDHYNQRWCYAQFSSVFVLYLATPYFSLYGTNIACCHALASLNTLFHDERWLE